MPSGISGGLFVNLLCDYVCYSLDSRVDDRDVVSGICVMAGLGVEMVGPPVEAGFDHATGDGLAVAADHADNVYVDICRAHGTTVSRCDR